MPREEESDTIPLAEPDPPPAPVAPRPVAAAAAAGPSSAARPGAPKKKKAGKAAGGEGGGKSLAMKALGGLFAAYLAFVGVKSAYTVATRYKPGAGPSDSPTPTTVSRSTSTSAPAGAGGAAWQVELPPIPPPTLPDVAPGREIEPGVVFHEMRLPGGPNPGDSGKLWLYLPAGEHAPHSLPCVIITGAGSNLITGMDLGDGDRPEHLPYAKAGFAVLAYEMDGAVDEKANPTDAQVTDAIRKFHEARAGLVNAKVALEFLKAKVPQVDPGRIFAAGHSSAATAALLVAAFEPSLKGCVAYAPVVDLRQRLAPAIPALRAAGYMDLVDLFSPSAVWPRMKCPLFVFHSEQDANVRYQDSQAFVYRMQKQGKAAEIVTPSVGDHYESMINFGISDGIKWMRKQIGLETSEPPSAAPAPIATPSPAPSRPDPAKQRSAADQLGPIARSSARASVVDFRFVGADEDRVGHGGNDAGRPNGEKDLQFRVELDLPPGATVDEMAVSSGGFHRWITRPNDRYWILGVEQGGRSLTPGYVETFGPFAGRQAFDLFAQGDQKSGTPFEFRAYLTIEGRPVEVGGQCVREKAAPRPGTVASGTSDGGATLVSFQWVDDSHDMIGRNGPGQDRANGEADQHFRVVADLPQGAVIDNVAVALRDSHTKWQSRPDTFIPPLAIFRGEVEVVRTHVEVVGEFSGRNTFDLYGSGNFGVESGKLFDVEIDLSIGGAPHKISATCERP